MYCAYLRKSRADRDAEMRGEGETLERHRKILMEYSSRIQIEITEFYAEIVSGETISDRPVMQRLLADVEAGAWEGVFVVEVERLARGNTRDQGIVADAFKYSRTRIMTPAKIYDPENEFDEEYFEFGLFMSRREYKTINRRLQRGRIASVKEGNFIGSTAPFGYRKIKSPFDKGYTLEIIPEQADIIRQIFNWYCYGELSEDGTRRRMGTDAIAAKLDLLGIKPPIKDFWSKASINDMLKNKTYNGSVSFGRQKEVKISTGGQISSLRKTDPAYLCVNGKHPPIIHDQLFSLAQEIRKENRKNTLPGNTILQNPLSGILYCKKCGRLMSRLAPTSHNPYAVIRCPNRNCRNISCPLSHIEDQLFVFLTAWLKDCPVVLHSGPEETAFREISEKEKALTRRESELAALQKQFSRTYDFLEQGIYTPEVFQQRQTDIQKNIEELEQSRIILQTKLHDLKDLQDRRSRLVPQSRKLTDACRLLSPAARNKVLRLLLVRVEYEKTEPNRRGQRENMNFTLDIYPRFPAGPG